MKRLLLFMFVCAILFFSMSSSFAENVAELDAGMYLVGKDIEPGSFTISPALSGKYPTVFYGDYKSVDRGMGDFVQTVMKPISLELHEGKYLRVVSHALSLESTFDKPVSSTQTEQKTNTAEPDEKKLSTEEINSIIKKAPYVSSKNIVITSPDGVDFYSYFGSGLIMSNASGDCFEMKKCDDEFLVSHYKIMPVKAGKGKIEYNINMKQTIVVNITVKQSAIFGETGLEGYVKKGVNLRAEPNSSSEKVGFAKQGEKVHIIKANYTEKWHQISYDGITCYVSSNYIEIE